MAGYFITHYDITDDAMVRRYVDAVGATLAKYGGKVLVSGPGAQTVEGDPRLITVVVEFESIDVARAWYDDPEYQAIAGLRLDASANGWAVLAEGR